MTDHTIKEVILKSHLRGEKKVVPWVRKKLPHVSEEKILAVLETLTHDKYKLSKDDTSKHYYVPIFTPFMGGFQIDLIEQTHYKSQAGAKQNAKLVDQFLPYFFVAINVNTKYAYAYPLKSKSEADILKCLNLFAADLKKVGVGKLVFISADKEPAWEKGQAIRQWLTVRKCKLKLIESERHSALGVVDRFIRELRDMNAKSGKEATNQKADHDARKYRDFTPNRMAKLINIHNTSFNTSIDMTPLEMETHPEKQKEYIIKKVCEANRRKKISDFELTPDTWVRFMVPRNMMEKRRYQFSNEIVKVVKKDGNAWVCEAVDGTQKKLARWRLLVAKESKFKKLKTFTGVVYWKAKKFRR
jgi:hypothetical protein